MTFPDENRYPPAEQQWWQPQTEPRWYGYDAPRYEPYGQPPRHEPYGQPPRHEPYDSYLYETPRRATDLAALRSAYRLLRRISTLTALGSFVVYVVLSCWAPGLMGSKIAGELSLGMALGVLQLVVTFAAVFWYGRSAQRSVDPLARAVREGTVPAGRYPGVAR
ncbi:DUF485 domain-containing protein [Streptomyces sp. NPDC059010]|uniref:DUF485 domain-containing protein n=1 Tax=Streptomyces sp. NPDC059010 TaxID=3346695 RepID=UPI00367CD8CC